MSVVRVVMLILILLVTFMAAFLGPPARPAERSSERLIIQGMCCQECGERVKDVISSLPGVDSVAVNAKSGCTEVFGESTSLRDSSVSSAVRQAGFRIIAQTTP